MVGRRLLGKKALDTIEIGGKAFQRCDQQGCQWCIVCSSSGLSIPGFELSPRGSEKHLVCNFGVAAHRILGGLPEDCPYQEQVRILLDRTVYLSEDNEPYLESDEPRSEGQNQ